MNEPEVSIIILNWNGHEDTIECLESLKKISYSNYKIIVIDNASSGDDVKILQERFGDYIHIIANKENLGFPEGCNIAMRYALEQGTDYMLLLNNDVIVDPQFLTELINVAEGDPSVGIVGSKIYEYYFPDKIQAAGGKIYWWLGWVRLFRDVKENGKYDKLAERDYVWGTSLLLKRSVIDAIGLLDTYFFFAVEEYDYCTRVKRAGFKIMYTPESKIWHKLGASRAKLPQYPETQEMIRRKRGRNNYKYYYRLFRTHCPPVLFLFPFLLWYLRESLVVTFFVLALNRDWKRIKEGILKRLRLVFS